MFAVVGGLTLLAGMAVTTGERMVRVLVWSEGTAPKEVYPNDIRGEIAKFLGEGDRAARFIVKAATITDPEQGISDAALDGADVLVWWGHAQHGAVQDDVAARIVMRVKAGRLGFVALHSSHKSKPFMALVGTSGDIASWREDGKSERVTVAAPNHPVAAGLPAEFTIEHEEMYAEPFQIPEPETVVFRSRFEGDETFRSGCAFRVGEGRVFYFRPGHESYPTYFDPHVQRVIANAIEWTAPKPAAPTVRPLPRLPIVATYVAKQAGSEWAVDRVAQRTFTWTTRVRETPPPLGRPALSIDAVLGRVHLFPGSPLTLAQAAQHPVSPEDLRFNREKGEIIEAYDALYDGAPRLRRMSLAIYADLRRINLANGRYVDWPDDFERLGPEAGTMLEWPDAVGGPQRTWRAFTENNPGALLSNFEYGLALRQLWVGGAFVTEYHLSGPRSDWVKAFNGVDIYTPLATKNGQPAYLLTTVLDLHIDFNVGNPGDGMVFDSMSDTLLDFKRLAETLLD